MSARVGIDGMTPQERKQYGQYALRSRKAGRTPITKDHWLHLRHDPEHNPYANIRYITQDETKLQVEQPPSGELNARQIIQRQKEDFLRKAERESALSCLSAKIPEKGPIGILFFGDPHLDDGGTDWFALERDMKLVKETEGLYGANIGDTTNNWIGRLEKLHASQSVTASQAWELAKYFIGELAGRWLFHIGGNHDGWSADRDPLGYICVGAGALYLPCEARLRLDFPVGEPMTVNARHDFAGNSMWNTAHAPNRAHTMGYRDEIMICGHKHKSGYNILKAPEGTVGHAIQIASYKRYDRYQKEKGFRDQTLSPCCLTVIDPEASDPVDRVQVFWNPERGAAYLKWLRGQT